MVCNLIYFFFNEEISLKLWLIYRFQT
jgi:hypothetical protein